MRQIIAPYFISLLPTIIGGQIHKHALYILLILHLIILAIYFAVTEQRGIFMKYIKLAILIVLLSGTSSFANFTGKWLVESGESIVNIQKCGNSLCGNIIWLKTPLNEDGTKKLDINNKDVTKQQNPIIGLQLIWGFEFKDGAWINGNIYNPKDGKIYSSKMTLNSNDTLALDGCVWILCKSQIWTRLK